MSTGAGQIRVLAVDDHPITREGIARLIVIQHDMVLVGQASDVLKLFSSSGRFARTSL